MPIQRQPAHISAVVDDPQFPTETMADFNFFAKEWQRSRDYRALIGLIRTLRELLAWALGIRRAGA